jgi:hypothetical protein
VPTLKAARSLLHRKIQAEACCLALVQASARLKSPTVHKLIRAVKPPKDEPQDPLPD